MDKYLLELLKEFKTVIIPDLGAITVVDQEKNEFMFMPYLKHNDGTLAEYIAEKEGKDLNEAKNIVAKYVREIIAVLDKGETYDMFQFGSFQKDSSGDIVFFNWDESNYAQKTPETDQITEEATTAIVSDPSEIEEIATEDTNELTEPTPIENELKNDFEEAIEATDHFETKTEPEVKNTQSETKSISPEREFNILEKEEQAATQAKLDTLRKQKEEATKKKSKKGVGFYLLILLIVMVVAGSGYIIYDYESLKSQFFAENSTSEVTESSTVTKEESKISEPAEKKEAELIEEPVPEKPVVDKNTESVQNTPERKPKQEPIPVTHSSGSGSHHIIAGSFSTEANAQKFIAKIAGNGINPTIIKKNGLYAVSLGSYATREEAKNALASLNYSGNARVSFVN